ncbi:MAG: DUF2062 domain-containing protein [Thermoanaerobaculum sp.]|nr:DUF2062 domain-containing protein [Thermoanaerobaculum sp.]
MNWRLAKARLSALLHEETSPHVVAASWACGVAIGLSPFLGLHTALALVLSLALRLNKLDVLLGTLIVNPWTMAPYFLAAVSLGGRITGKPIPFLPELPQPASLWDRSFWQAQEAFLAPLLVNWLVGASTFAGAGGAVVYFSLRYFLARRRRAHATP